MGLDTTHNAWHGPYSTFNAWRAALAEAAGFPPLFCMEGFYDPHTLITRREVEQYLATLTRGTTIMVKRELPIKWDNYLADPLSKMLSHSDCDGKILAADCEPIAYRLVQLLPKLPARWTVETMRFIAGLEDAASNFEDVHFH